MLRLPRKIVRLVHARPSVAQALWGLRRWSVLVIFCSIALGLLALYFFINSQRIAIAVPAMLLAFTGLMSMPFWLKSRIILLVDRRMNDIHWRVNIGFSEKRENFPADRLNHLQLKPVQFLGFTVCRVLELTCEHPRLPVIPMWRGWRIPRGEAQARRLAACLEIPWFDLQDLRHEPMPGRIDPPTDDVTGLKIMKTSPPAADVLCYERKNRIGFMFTSPREPNRHYLNMLKAASVWCCSTGGGLIILRNHLKQAGESSTLDYFLQAVLLGLVITGIVFLWQAMIRLAGRETIEFDEHDCYCSIRLFGLYWTRQRLLAPRNLTLPLYNNKEGGGHLRMRTNHGKRNIGRGLSSESLAWLQDLLRRYYGTRG